MANIGNLAKTTKSIPSLSFVQTFKYDAINRLSEATEKTGTTQNWKQTFGYDRFGNRTSFYQIVGSTELPTNNLTRPTVDPANNQFTTGQGYVYDLNGNLVQDAQGRSFTFNGDDKQTEVRDTATNALIGQYFYDGSGARVKKFVPGTGETTVFVYDAGGALAAEYSTIVAPVEEAATSYLTTDHVGSPRVITDASGGVIARRDFMPFGEELGVGVSSRSESLKYSNTDTDQIRKRFTGYEKDGETQLDFAEARMYENRHGRFTAPDPLLASSSPANPQTFNRYTYTGNNPINYTDPSGLTWCQASDGTVTWNGKIGKACVKGTTDVDGGVLQLIEGPGGVDSSGNRFGVGDLLQFDRQGTRLLIQRQQDVSRIAKETGTEVQATYDVVSTDAATISDHIVSAFMTVGENNGGHAIAAVLGKESYDRHTVIGQGVGNVLSIFQGGAEVAGGLGTSGGGAFLTALTSPLCGTGILCAVPASTAVVTAAGLITATHGAGVITNSVYNMVNNQGPGSRRGWESTPENVERMKQGKPPIGNDGHPVELHHVGQKPDSKLVPITRTEHRGKGSYKKNHPNRGPSKINRTEHAKQRKEYWKKKAKR